MRGLVYHGPRDVRHDVVPDPILSNPAGAIVRVSKASICGSDLHIFHGENARGTGFTIGHEAIGQIVEAGAEVHRFKAGDRVLVSAGVRCGRCEGCASGPHCTVQGDDFCYGLGPDLPGSQAELLEVPYADANLLRLPADVSEENALLLADCANTAWYGAKKAKIAPGSEVAVIGLGPIGLVAVMSAFIQGASRVFAVDPVADRRRRAEELGASGLPPEGAKALIVEATRGGVGHVVDAVGTDESIGLALRVVRNRGAVSVIGLSPSRRMAFPMMRAQMLSLDFHIGLATGEDTPGLLNLMRAGRFNPSVVFSHRLPLSAGVSAYDLLDRRADGVCKVLLDATA
nr:alcohol dehydrogenase family protein [Dactylosporangium thailandense]